jgi:hypothetical protein
MRGRAAVVCAASLGLLASVVSTVTPAQANGRFPFANQFLVQDTAPDHLFVRTSFGILVSTDAGQHFDWICESLIGFSGTQDPGLAVFSDGSLSVAAFEGLFGSNDQGCSFAENQAFAGEYVIDVAVARSAPLHAVAVTSTARKTGPGYHVQALQTLDGGAHWATLGVPLDQDLLALTIDVAPSRERRLYVSGFVTLPDESRVGILESSDDAGATWSRTEIPLGTDTAVYIGAVDPVNPDVVYLRTDGVDDRLLVTRDGGKTVEAGPAFPGALLGLAVSPDGGSVAIGGPAGGVRVASVNTSGGPLALSFEQRSDKQVTCLTWREGGLYACGNDFTDGFFLGRSDDGGTTWVPLAARLRDVRGPLTTCPAGSPYETTCPPLWPAQRAALGGSSEPEVGGQGGAGGAMAGSGGAAAAGGAGAAGISGEAPAPTTDGDDGCGCRLPRTESRPSSTSTWLSIVAWLAFVGVSRTRRRSRSARG